MKILAIQGSPRPKASNTQILLQEFLKGACSQGAEAETIYLKEKEFHPYEGGHEPLDACEKFVWRRTIMKSTSKEKTIDDTTQLGSF